MVPLSQYTTHLPPPPWRSADPRVGQAQLRRRALTRLPRGFWPHALEPWEPWEPWVCEKLFQASGPSLVSGMFYRLEAQLPVDILLVHSYMLVHLLIFIWLIYKQNTCKVP